MKTRVPRLKALAKVIEAKFPELIATVERSYCNTDRKVGRLIHPGKGRHGNLLTVIDRKTGQRVFRHDSAETYRTNDEVVRWIEGRERKTK